jgi:hypothetical protein
LFADCLSRGGLSRAGSQFEHGLLDEVLYCFLSDDVAHAGEAGGGGDVVGLEVGAVGEGLRVVHLEEEEVVLVVVGPRPGFHEFERGVLFELLGQPGDGDDGAVGTPLVVLGADRCPVGRRGCGIAVGWGALVYADEVAGLGVVGVVHYYYGALAGTCASGVGSGVGGGSRGRS